MEAKNEILELSLRDNLTPDGKFLPSKNGFRFGNAFKPQKYAVFFDHAAGMCGGMVFAIRDFHESGAIPPSTDQVPTAESNKVLLDHIAGRQIDSVTQPSLMNYLFMPSFGQTEIEKVYSQIKEDIMNNHLSILGLVRTTNLLNITKDHQVGVYRLMENNNCEVKLFIYDPKVPGRDDIFVTFNGKHFIGFTYSHNGLGPIYSMFHPTYTYKVPPFSIVSEDNAKQKFEPT